MDAARLLLLSGRGDERGEVVLGGLPGRGIVCDDGRRRRLRRGSLGVADGVVVGATARSVVARLDEGRAAEESADQTWKMSRGKKRLTETEAKRRINQPRKKLRRPCSLQNVPDIEWTVRPFKAILSRLPVPNCRRSVSQSGGRPATLRLHSWIH